MRAKIETLRKADVQARHRKILFPIVGLALLAAFGVLAAPWGAMNPGTIRSVYDVDAIVNHDAERPHIVPKGVVKETQLLLAN